MKVNVDCSRCGKNIDGDYSPSVTAGFYDVSEGPWAKYAQEDEETLCDNCMWNDAGYQRDYGNVNDADNYGPGISTSSDSTGI